MKSIEKDNFEQTRSEVLSFVLGIALAVLLFYFFILYCLGSTGSFLKEGFEIFSLTSFFLFTPYTLRRLPFKFVKGKNPISLLLLLLVASCIPALLPDILKNIFAFVIAVSGVASAAFFIHSAGISRRWQQVLIILMGLFCGAVFSFFFYEQNYLVQLIPYIQVRLDKLMFSSISAMVDTYGVPSVGIDGLKYVPYHWGTYWIFGQWASLFKINQFTFSNDLFKLICIPLFIQSCFEMGFLLFKNVSLKTRYKPLIILVFMLGFTGVSDIDTMRTVTSWPAWTPLIGSPSQILGLAAGFFSIVFFQSYFAQGLLKKSFQTTLGITVFIFVLTFVKLSIGALLVAIFCSWLFFDKLAGLSLKQKALYIFTAIGVFGLAFSFTHYSLPISKDPFILQHYGTPQTNEWLELFGFIHTYIKKGLRLKFVYLHFFWIWFLTLVFLLFKGIKKVTKISQFKFPYLPFYLTALSATIPMLTFGGTPNPVYFTDSISWAAIAMGSVAVAYFVQSAFKVLERKWPLKTLLATVALYSSVMLLLLCAPRINLRTYVYYFFESWSGIRQMLLDGKHEGWVYADPVKLDDYISKYSFRSPAIKYPFAIQFFSHPEYVDQIRKNIEDNKVYQTYKELASLSMLPRSIRKESMVFIPQSNTYFWGKRTCYYSPMLIPSLTSMTALDGVQPYDCRKYDPGNGLGFYPLRRSPQEHYSDQRLCEMTREKGYRRVFIVGDGRSPSAVRTLDCPTL